MCDGVCGYPAGTTMHLIINSLDTRGWMSDGFRQERSRSATGRTELEGEKGFVTEAEVGGEWRFGKREEGR